MRIYFNIKGRLRVKFTKLDIRNKKNIENVGMSFYIIKYPCSDSLYFFNSWKLTISLFHVWSITLSLPLLNIKKYGTVTVAQWGQTSHNDSFSPLCRRRNARAGLLGDISSSDTSSRTNSLHFRRIWRALLYLRNLSTLTWSSWSVVDSCFCAGESPRDAHETRGPHGHTSRISG